MQGRMAEHTPVESTVLEREHATFVTDSATISAGGRLRDTDHEAQPLNLRCRADASAGDGLVSMFVRTQRGLVAVGQSPSRSTPGDHTLAMSYTTPPTAAVTMVAAVDIFTT